MTSTVYHQNKPTFFIVLAMLLAARALSASASPANGSLPHNLQIMPLGDSITCGSGGHHGYRGPLGDLLSSVSTNFVFVGSFTDKSLPENEQHHEGHGSYAIDDIYTNLDGFGDFQFQKWGGESRKPNGGHWFDGIASGPNARLPLYPNVILLLIGANDRDNLEGAQSRLDRLVSKIVTMRPKARLIIARITPITKSDAYKDFVGAYNQAVDAVVAKYAPHHLVTEVDLNTGFPSDGLGKDKLHPNDIGYDWMAKQWYNAILEAFDTRQSRQRLGL
ncbi:MAG TPA: GDSL-type esterase/lipase family protein [Candidatus Acidoferrum sp.]|nr:GDSL-type esterase/lipase family protein [Candidatus Acidoferrum sp.]